MKKKTIDRREFLRLSATAGVGALLVPQGMASAMDTDTAKESGQMPVRTLGRTGIEIPILSMGVMRADNPNLVRAAYNSGIFHFDTAHGYQNGRNEEMLGNFFKDKPRDSFFIATKVKSRYPYGDDFEAEFDTMAALSLSRLQMDSVDVLYAHDLNSVDEVKNGRLIAQMEKMKREGKARFIGFTTHCNKLELLDAAVETGVWDVILTTYNFKLDNLEETGAAIERAARAGIGIVAMKTMTGGSEDAEGNKKINAEACLKWVWQNENVTTIIPGFTNYDELDECFAAVNDPELTGEEIEYLAGLRDSDMMFCQQCRTCIPQCPRNLPIPDIMRAYMYTYGYKFSRLSKETLAELDFPKDACSGCGECGVKCPSGFDIAAKISAITPVLNIPEEFLT